MRFSARLQLLTCLVVYASSAHAIMVKFGTKEGPIVPPTPEPTPAPQPYRNPAPVWEERSNDTPDPNAQWRPPFFVPHPRYTNAIYNSPPPPQQLNNAQRFINAYIPLKPLQPLQRSSIHQQNPPAILGSQSLPGIGLRYFFPAYATQQKPAKQEDAKFNQIDSVHEPGAVGVDSAHDFQWKYEKDATRRNIRNSLESTVKAPVYQWPAYVPPRHH
ncbi:uncharacterized protein LOC118282281 [Spodoptera frugiperda]|uniref:Uncharacterized protein LOC118282281 n=1 Tax=Spodoptera frugiperda TaxID=7108 RepID=A0A9R0F291_SPOFR|nr:uncharacterized protein LOC118282281 [Spodoptera frugiperda]XP_050557638.1 uncharacterized protein LOC118282281 [Spodoptera frugiperda]